jgi:hypothetical protein
MDFKSSLDSGFAPGFKSAVVGFLVVVSIY